MLGEALLRPGDSHYFTAHNNYMDFVLLGGIGYLVVFIGLCLSVGRESLRLYRLRSAGPLSSIMLGLIIMYAIASMFTGGLTYQPALATLWWAFVGFAWRLEVNRLHGSKPVMPRILRMKSRLRRPKEALTS